MVKSVKMKQIYTDTLSCEPIVRRTQNGELLCVCQCGGITEPMPENRVYVFHSRDNGQTWSGKISIFPEDGQAVYCTEVSVIGDEITAYLTFHTGRFLDWKCLMVKSYDNGYTWKNAGTPPYFPEYTFMRGTIVTSDKKILIPYQYYPVTREAHDKLLASDLDDKPVVLTNPEYAECGVLISEDNGKSYDRFTACRIKPKAWVWTEPTIAERDDGVISMLIRYDGSGSLWQCDSADGGKTWSELGRTDIVNPGNKPKLIKLDKGRIALLHTPDPKWRFPLELWISDDNMKTWGNKTVLTDFPGVYSYSDGFYEDGHIRFTVEHNRHSIIYFDVEL